MDLYKFYLSPEKLDEYFDNAVDRVILVISQLTNKDLITPIWTRWFQILKNASIEEKFARYDIVLELNKQLIDNKTLGYPFTDAQNCNIDLSTLSQMIMDKRAPKPETSVNDGANTQAKDSDESESMVTIWSSNIAGSMHYCMETENRSLLEEKEALVKAKDSDESESMVTIWSSNRAGSMDYCMETENRSLLEEKEALVIQLQEEQLKHELLQRRHQKNLKMIKALKEEGKYLDEQLAQMKQVFSWSSVTSTKLLNTNKALTATPQYFVTLFSVLCETEEDIAGIQELDNRFKKFIDSYINNYLGKKRCLVLQNLSKEYDVLKADVSARYKNVMHLQMVAQEKELYLMAMRYLALLRMIFLSSYKGSKSTKKAAINFLLDRSKEVSEEL